MVKILPQKRSWSLLAMSVSLSKPIYNFSLRFEEIVPLGGADSAADFFKRWDVLLNAVYIHL